MIRSHTCTTDNIADPVLPHTHHIQAVSLCHQRWHLDPVLRCRILAAFNRFQSQKPLPWCREDSSRGNVTSCITRISLYLRTSTLNHHFRTISVPLVRFSPVCSFSWCFIAEHWVNDCPQFLLECLEHIVI